MKKLSIIVVTYNAEKTIENTLLSIIPFLGDGVELICKDGESKDSTPEILNRYREHISTLKFQSDSGVYDGMNQAVELSSSDYVMFINSGDELIKLSVDEINDSSTCFYWDEARDLVKRDMTTRWFLTRNTPCHQSVIYKKSEFLPYNLDYGLAADFEQIVRLVKAKGKGLSLNSSIVKYANPGLSSQYYQPTFKQLLKQLLSRYKTISDHFGIMERAMCVVFSTRTILLKLFKGIR